MASDRQTGRTTEQMKAAPINATFVWPVSGSTNYALRLARDLGRGDLNIVSVETVNRGWLIGRGDSAVILDHAVHTVGPSLSDESIWRIDMMNSRIERKS